MKKWFRVLPLLFILIPMQTESVLADRLFTQMEYTTVPGVGEILLSIGIICTVIFLFGLQQRRAEMKGMESEKDEPAL